MLIELIVNKNNTLVGKALPKTNGKACLIGHMHSYTEGQKIWVELAVERDKFYVIKKSVPFSSLTVEDIRSLVKSGEINYPDVDNPPGEIQIDWVLAITETDAFRYGFKKLSTAITEPAAVEILIRRIPKLSKYYGIDEFEVVDRVTTFNPKKITEYPNLNHMALLRLIKKRPTLLMYMMDSQKTDEIERAAIEGDASMVRYVRNKEPEQTKTTVIRGDRPYRPGDGKCDLSMIEQYSTEEHLNLSRYKINIKGNNRHTYEDMEI